MKIGVMSDTHGSVYFFEKAMAWMKDCDWILHAGDVLQHNRSTDIEGGFAPTNLALMIGQMDQIIFAQGNCDSYSHELMIGHPLHFPYTLVEKGNLKIMLCHGHTHTRSYLIQQAEEMDADILIFGHTHVKELGRHNQLVILNPGSTTHPRDGSRSIALIEERCVCLVDIENGEVIKSISF